MSKLPLIHFFFFLLYLLIDFNGISVHLGLFYVRKSRLLLFYVYIFCLMAYQPSWVIFCQCHHYRRISVILFNPLTGESSGGAYLSQRYQFERGCKSVTGTRTCLLRYRSLVRQPLCFQGLFPTFLSFFFSFFFFFFFSAWSSRLRTISKQIYLIK